MTERQAAVFANKIYTAAYAKQISASDAMNYLARLEPYMSGSQLGKFSDFIYAVKHNPSFFA